VAVKSSKSVFRALRQLAGEERPTGAADLAKELSLPMTTAVRALSTLEAAGYAERYQASSRYVLGKAARTLAFGFLAQFPVRDLAIPYLQRITLETGATSSLFVKLGWYAVRVAAVLGPHVVMHNTPIGEARSLLVGAPSLAMLSHLGEGELTEISSHHSETASQLRAIEKSLPRFRQDGIAMTESVVAPGAIDLAVPLFNNQERPIASIALEGLDPQGAKNLVDPQSPARQIISDLASKTRNELSVSLSHYEHVDPKLIEL
jgi:DNA-binding IclR family transcriptional regulator